MRKSHPVSYQKCKTLPRKKRAYTIMRPATTRAKLSNAQETRTIITETTRTRDSNNHGENEKTFPVIGGTGNNVKHNEWKSTT